MPVDTTRIIPTRRTQKKITQEELRDIELKRIRGELSCAECRRLKLRCDKKVPCSSCVRRGCESICPCGILSAGQGSRFILADTDQLHKKISEMSNRIRQLEDALAILQATISDRPHALLTEDHLKIKFGSEAILPKDEEGEEREASIDALGTLTLEDSGESRYFGRSAGTEVSSDSTPSAEETENLHVPLSPELEGLSNSFPFTRFNMSADPAALKTLESYLPTWERGLSLAQFYIDHASFFYRPVKREELFDSILPRTYSSLQSTAQAAEPSPQLGELPREQNVPESLRPHELAMLFFIFALGALLDLNLPPYNAEAEYFYELGRAALSLKAVYESPSIDTVRAMGLMATYHTHAGRKYSRDSAWCIMSFTAKMAQSIGLHRDSARWMMDATTVQMRRNLFWETFAADVSHSLALGRPPAIHLSYVDCEFPLDEEATIDDETGQCQDGFWRMKHVFAKSIFYPLAETTLVAKAPSYQTILDLDRKVRSTPFWAHFRPYVTREEGEEEFYSSSLSLRGFYASQHRAVTMLYLHRSFFAQAVLDHPTNPLLSPFAPSFLTAYRCASVIIRATAHQFERCAPLSMRIWFLLCQTFSAAACVIVGTVVTRSPNSAVAASALLDLDIAIDLFKNTAPQSYRARIALGVLRKLKETAVLSYNESCSSNLPAQTTGSASHLNPQVSGLFSVRSLHDAEDELALFGGQARLLTRKSKPKPAETGTLVSSPEPSTACESHPNTPGGSPSSDSLSMPDVHPSLIEYFQHDTTRQSRMQSYPHSIPNSGSHPPPRSSPSHVGSRKSGSPPGRDVGEMYNNFMGYIASKSISTIPSTPGVVPPSMRDYRPPSTQSNGASGRRDSSANMTSPSAINRWEQPSGRTVPRQNHPRHDPSSAAPGYSTGSAEANALNSWMALNPANTGFSPNQYYSGMESSPTAGMDTSTLLAPSQNQGGMTGAAYNSRSDPMAFQGFSVDPSYLGSSFLPGAAPFAPNQNSMDPMVEMGLTTESGMDEGWLSFMRECGIMENGRPPQL
ncbi:hypothetical protein AGABI1DRAFT_54232 [Agaricus bisporus var. burnettii JB137-S8]|uniref:Zn(2)-C6 fungal-type domain-containing protein n=1 Tax=Agaricus bisporus var. burnettii (strain JB137-S8 / ATCC MYA-4627 / FGSC 10392) TaxID=597362 RepID=K5X0X6_AGABU|nr:uncharacterized protein AGABI1DRAFT_54232 [Agaricus bisporus var. burnettii JB137-S8]EKM81461.1 hypothetical protein AGABI1DRAFT_54232 [Agaricus bisporus var. burnettii JB137-S8]